MSHATLNNQLSTTEFLEFVYRVYKMLNTEEEEGGDQRSEFEKYWSFMQDFIESEVGPVPIKDEKAKTL